MIKRTDRIRPIRAFLVLVLVLVVVLLVSTPVFAYLYRAPVAITENASTSYGMLPVLWNQNNTWLAANGFMNSTANDTRVQTLGGSNKPWMVADNKTLTAVPVPSDSQTNLYFVTGESEASAMDIIVGYGGYFTVSDDPALELSNNFSVEATVCIAPDIPFGNLFYKKDSYAEFIEAPGTVTASILGATVMTTPTGTSDPGAVWAGDGQLIDDNTGTAATNNVGASSWSDYILATFGASNIDSARVYPGFNNVNDLLDVDLYASGNWYDIYQGTVTNLAWNTYNLGYVASNVTQLRMRVYNSQGAPSNEGLYEVDYGLLNETLSVTATGMSAVSQKVEVYANTLNMAIVVDDVVIDTVAQWGASVPNTGNNILVMSNATPYLGYLSITIAGTEVARYEPVTIVTGTTLPDVVGSYDATITWGSNPAGVAVSLGSMTSSGQPSVGGAAGTGTGDILPPAGGSDWRPVPGVSTTLQANPLRPIVTAISDNTTLSEYQVWVWLAIAFVAFITVLVGSRVRGHHLITGVAASAAIILMIAWTIFPIVSLVVVVLAIWGGLVSERSPSL